MLDSELARAFPNEFWGQDRSGRRGSLSLIAGDWGPVIVVNMTFPISQGEAASANEMDPWEEARRELSGKGPKNDTKDWRGAKTKSRTVDRDKLSLKIRSVLSTYGPRIRGLTKELDLHVLVFGGRSTSDVIYFESLTEKKGQTLLENLADDSASADEVRNTVYDPWLGGAYRYTYGTRSSVPESASFLFRLRGRWIEAASKDSEGGRAGLAERVEVYAR